MTPAPEMDRAQIARAYNNGATVSSLMTRTGLSYEEIQDAIRDGGATVRTGGPQRATRRR